MEYTIQLIVILHYLLYVSSSVPTDNKNGDVPPTVVQNKLSENKDNIVKSNKWENTFQFNGSFVYLDDVLFALKNQFWTEEEKPCLDQTVLMLKGLQNFTLWAVWMWDAISSEPQGLLFGSRYHLGNFDECLTSPWYKDRPELRTQYCLADITLNRTDNSVRKKFSNPYDPYQSALNVIEHTSLYRRPLNELTWGVCVPAVCNRDSVVRLMGILLTHSHLGVAGLKANVAIPEECQKSNESLKYDGMFYAFIGMISFLIAVSLICTIFNRNGSKLKCQFTNCFDLRVNAKSILVYQKDGLEVLYGVRFLSICIIVMCHLFGTINGGPISDGYMIDKEIFSIIGLLTLHGDLAVDTFFLLSGLLTAVNLLKIKNGKFNPLKLFLKRYIRLVVAYAITIFYVIAVHPYTGSGPLWNRNLAPELQSCKKNWWISLLMLGNYIDTENICLVVSWYIPCDFHFFVFTVLMYWLYTRFPKFMRFLFVFVTIAAVITPGIYNYLHNLPPIQLFTYDFISNPRGPKQFHLTYIKSHTRYATYLIGFFSGCLFTKYYKNKNKRISQKWATIGACVGFAVMMAVEVSGPPFLWRGYTMLESVLYSALNRPAWACSAAFCILCCVFGYVPLLCEFLCWYPWVPLSRLVYGLYLVHGLLIMRNVNVSRNDTHNDYIILLILWLGVVMTGSFIAFVLFLIAEAPINKLATLILMPRIKPINLTMNEITSNTNMCRGEKNEGYLHDNLPPTVHIDSSKV